jgi:hypothetical protein
METKNQSLFNLTNDELSKLFYHEQDKNGFGKMIKLKLNFKNNKSRVFRFTGRLGENNGIKSIVLQPMIEEMNVIEERRKSSSSLEYQCQNMMLDFFRSDNWIKHADIDKLVM